jgi:DNA replication protein DnaC
LLLSPSIGIAQKIPPPEEFFGFKAGADFHLINYKQAVDYWKKLEKLSGKIKLFEYGKSSEGKTMILAVISSEENMAKSRMGLMNKIPTLLTDFARQPVVLWHLLLRENQG